MCDGVDNTGDECGGVVRFVYGMSARAMHDGPHENAVVHGTYRMGWPVQYGGDTHTWAATGRRYNGDIWTICI